MELLYILHRFPTEYTCVLSCMPHVEKMCLTSHLGQHEIDHSCQVT
jgi:hypothetical protein